MKSAGDSREEGRRQAAGPRMIASAAMRLIGWFWMAVCATCLSVLWLAAAAVILWQWLVKSFKSARRV